MQTIRRFLVIRADGGTRVTTRTPRIAMDEVAYPLKINVPSSWGRLQEAIELTLPEAPVVEVENAPTA